MKEWRCKCTAAQSSLARWDAAFPPPSPETCQSISHPLTIVEGLISEKTALGIV